MYVCMYAYIYMQCMYEDKYIHIRMDIQRREVTQRQRASPRADTANPSGYPTSSLTATAARSLVHMSISV